MGSLFFTLPGVIFLGVMYIITCVRIISEWERAVILTFGRLRGEAKGPGLFLVFWPVQSMLRISLRTITLDVPPQDVITKDNVSMKVNAVVYFRVIEPNKAVVQVEDYLFATSQMAQTSLRSVLGQVELDELLIHRDELNQRLQTIIDKQTDPWGVKVSAVEIKQVDLPEEIRRAMARQAEAERVRRAKIIGAEAEFQAAQKLVDAAKLMGEHPMALQMRYLQTLAEIATSDKNSTTIFPIPIDLIKPFLDKKS
ncbi:MAG: slipin family protein [Candidatus Omnitrophica bacterium]|nr:slipin family protein [Candidatus Omnitrophota bacterium]